MLDEHEGHVAVLGHTGEQLRKCFQSAGRGANRDDREWAVAHFATARMLDSHKVPFGLYRAVAIGFCRCRRQLTRIARMGQGNSQCTGAAIDLSIGGSIVRPEVEEVNMGIYTPGA